MKKTLKFIACLSGWLALVVAGQAQNICVDTTTYSDPECLFPGSTNTLGVLSYTNLVVCIGDAITPPTATETTFFNGSSRQYVSHSCPDFYYLNDYVTNDEVYVAGDVYFVPPIPATFATATNFQCTALVNGIDSGGVCGDINGIVLGTVTITSFGPPSFVLQPTNKTAALGTNVTFTSVATGRAPLSYQWFFNATNVIVGATNASLTLTNLQCFNAGTYLVWATNTCGSTSSSNALLVITNLLSIDVQPKDVTITYGQPAPFCVDVSETAPCDTKQQSSILFQWQRNGANIIGATSSCYALNKPVVSDSGSSYRVIISQGSLCLTSRVASLIVTKATLSVMADGKTRQYGATNPPLTWSASGFVYGETTNVLSGAPTLSTGAVTTSGAGNYPITINAATLTSANYALVYFGGTLTIAKASLSITAEDKNRGYGATNPPLTWIASGFVNGQSVSVLSGSPQLNTSAGTNSAVGNYPIATSIGSLAAANYAFHFINGKLVVTRAALTITADNKSKATGATNPPLTGTITGVQNNDSISTGYSTPATNWSPAGTYPIVPALNDPNNKLPNYSLNISNGILTVADGAPNVLSQPETQKQINFGASVSLRVISAASSPLTYKWKKNGSNIADPNVTGITSNLFTITNFTSGNAGTYTLVISNSLGTNISSPTILATGNFANVCNSNIYPIAVPVSIITNTPGPTAITLRGDSTPTSGSFLWLTWNGNGNTPTLETDLTIPGDGYNYINPSNSEDRVISINDWMQISTGISSAVKPYLNALTNYCTNNFIQLPVWYHDTQGSGAGGIYQFYNYVTCKLLDYDLSGSTKSVTVSYWGTTQCEPTSISFSTTNCIYVENMPPVILDPGASISDFTIGTLTLRFITNGLPEDRLSITNQGTLTGQISISGTNIFYYFANNSPTQIGTFAGGVGTDPLVIQFNNNSTVEAVTAVARNLTYLNISENPSTAIRTISAVLSHAGTDNIQPALINVIVIPVNDPPVISIVYPTNWATFPAGVPITLIATASDVDSSIPYVRFLNGSNPIGTVTAVGTNYVFTWTNAPLWTNPITAIATDGILYATSSIVNVVVQPQPPQITIVSPTNGEVFAAPATVRIKTEVIAPDSIVTNVDILSGAAVIASITNVPFYLTTNLTAGSYTFGARAKDNNGLSGTAAPVSITVQSCSSAALSSLTLSTNSIIGGSNLSGTITLAAAAMTGGQVIKLACVNSSVIVPPTIFVPQGSTTVNFTINTLAVGSTNSASIVAAYHSQTPLNASLTILPTTSSTNVVQGAVRPGFDATVVVPDYNNRLNPNGEDGSIGPVDIGFPISFYSQDYSNLWVNMNGNVTFTGPYNTFTPELTIQEIGLPAIAPFWADVDPRGTYDSATSNGTMKYGTNTVDGHRAFGVTWDNVGYYGNQSDKSNRFQVVLIDRSDKGVGNFDIEFNYDRIQWETGYASGGTDGFGGSPVSIGFGDGQQSGFNFQGSGVSETFVDTNYTSGLVHYSYNSPVLGRYLFSVPFPVNKQIVVVRDDVAGNNFTAFTTSDAQRVSSASENSGFDLRAVSGTVLGAQIERAGQLRRNIGTHYDFEWGVGSVRSNSLSSFGPIQTDAQTLAAYYSYDMTWNLPAAFYSDIGSGLNGLYNLQPTDRISSLCGNTVQLQDLPNAGWPTEKNILTFLLSANPDIPQGRCRDIVLSGVNQFDVSDVEPAFNGAWDVIFNGQVIASSGQRNGWSVENDYTVYGGINVAAPSTALAASGYEVRLASQSSRTSGFFSLVSSNTLNSAPVLLPLQISNKAVTNGVPITVTVALDAPATGNGAIVSLKWDGASGGAIPDYIAIPAGQRTNQFTFAGRTNAAFNNFAIKASYNGYRKSSLYIVSSFGAVPSAPTNLIAVGQNGQVSLSWSPVSGALTYNVKRSTSSGGPYAMLFEGLSTTNYVDTQVTNGITYYYVVSALNVNGESGNSSQASATPQVPITTAKPVIAPNGGAFNDQVQVQITDATAGADIWYTVDGSIPVQNSPSLHYTAPFTLTSNATVRARAFLSGAFSSSVASASFSVYGTTPLACGTTNSDSLSFSSSFSTNRGMGYFVGRYTFPAVAGEQVTVSLSSTNFDTYLYLVDPTGHLVAQNDDANGSINSQIVYNTRVAGSYYVEATSAFPVQIGAYQISLSCKTNAEIGVLSSGAALPNRATLDFGVTTTGVNVSKTITITNVGSAPLNISNLSIVPSGTFTVSPTSLSPISPAGSATLTLTFIASSQGQFSSALYIINNDDDGRDGMENPVILNLTAHANLSGTAPIITVTAPTATQSFTAPAQVTNSATVTVGTSAISNVVFYLRTAGAPTVIGLDSTAPYSVTWSNVAGGHYSIYAVATDVVGRMGQSSDVTFFVNSPPVANADSATLAMNSISNAVQVLSNDSDPDGDSLSITGNTTPSHGTVVLVGNIYYYTPTSGYVGTDSFNYTNSDGHGGKAIGTVRLKVPPSTLPAPPIAQITSPLNNDRITAPTSVVGTAQSAYLDSYKLQVRPAGHVSTPWKTFITGTTVVSGGSLGILDPTLMLNGSYDIQLVVDDLAGQETESDILTVAITGSMKVGAFSISFPDLQIPVGSLPISLIRTYDSRNQNSGDFGVGWTLDVHSVRLDKNMSLGENWFGVTAAGFIPVYYLEDEGPHLITITFPDGTVERFEPVPLFSSGQRTVYFTPAYDYVHFDFEPLPGTHGRLSVSALNDLLIPPGPYGDYTGEATINEDGSGLGNGPIFDPSGYTYTTDDGRAFQFDASGKIVKMSDPNGNTLTFNHNGIIHSSGKSVKFVRDAVDRITSIYDPNGLDSSGNPTGAAVLVYKYDDPLGNLISVRQLTDRSVSNYVTTTLTYTNVNFPNYLTEIIDPRGVTASRQLYDDTGRLTGTVDAAGHTNLFSYDLNARTQTTTDALGNSIISTYDSHGNVTNFIDALQRQTSQTFDDDDHLTSVTDALHHTTYYTYDSDGNLSSVVDPLGNTNFVGYDSNGRMIATTNALGNVAQFQYDSHGNQTNVIDGLGHNSQVVYDTNGYPTTITDTSGRVAATGGYDAFGNLTNLTEAVSGVATAFGHDANGNQTGSTNVWINPTNSSDSRTVINRSIFDAENRETTKIDPDGSQSTVAYDSNGKQSQVTDEYNRTASWTYDARGNLIQISFLDGSVSSMVYDPAGRMTETDEKHVPGSPVNGTRTTYDAVGQIIKSEQLSNIVIDVTSDFNGIPSSSVTSVDSVIAATTYGYDLAGRQIAMTNGFGAVTHYEYDAAGRRTAVIDALSNRTDYVYDPTGNLIFTTNALRQVMQYVYDAVGRRVQTIYPDNSSIGLMYDAAGNAVSETNQLGLVTTYRYDDVSRLTNIAKPSVFDPESGVPANPKWGFAYDSYGQLQSTSDPKNHVTRFTYDALGRILTHTLPMNRTASQVYDSNGRPFRYVDFKGQTNEIVYDSIGRVATNRFYAVGSSTPSVLAGFAYDSQERAKEIVEARGTNRFSYDTQGNVTQLALPEGTLNYEYEPIAKRLVRTYTSNSDLRYGYDTLGRITTVTVIKRNGATLTIPEVTTNYYNELSKLADVFYPNGIHAMYRYDGVMNCLTNVSYATSNNVLLAQYQYSAKVNGQWNTVNEALLQTNGTYVTNRLVWYYDNAGRLTNEGCSSTLSALSYTNLYVYNLVGNRLWTTNIANAVTKVVGCSYNDNDQLLQEVTTVNGASAGTFTNSYNENGSLTNRSSATEQNSYSYNLQNKLATAIISRTESGHQLSETINFTYDYKGNRVRAQWSRSVDGGAVVSGTNYFLNDSKSASGLSRVLEELPSIGATPTKSYTLGGRIVSQSKNGVISHLLSDGHGSTRQLADTNGNIAANYTYDAYGKGLDFTNGTQNPTLTGLLYCGEQLDADLQLYNLRARYYDPATGRFNQIDPFGGNQTSGNNLYAYGAEDPINNTDPTGMYEVDVHQYLTQFLADNAGFGKRSVEIGQQTQNLDLDARDAMAGGRKNYILYHFVSKKRLAQMWNAVLPNNTFDHDAGEYFHALEDTYSHCTGVGSRNWDYYGNITYFGFTVLDNGGYSGHGHLGHEPDHTWRDVPKAMAMAQDVYWHMGILQQAYFNANLAPKDWTAIKGDIEKFMSFQPNVYKQTYKMAGINFIVENATFDGYNAKIALLNKNASPGVTYALDLKTYADPAVPWTDQKYANVVGQAPSKTVFGAVTRGYLIHLAIEVLVDPIGIE
jgi:RHS repeat-associated protein